MQEEDNVIKDKKITRREFVKISSTAAAITAAGQIGWKFFNYAPAQAAADPDVKVVRTVCAPNCVNSCAHNVFVKDEKIIRVEPGEFPDPEYRRICLKGISNAMQRTYHPDRVKYPMRRVGERGEDKWEQISWDQALDEISGKLTQIADKYGPEANSWMGMTGNYGINAQLIAQRAANTFGGTNLTNLGIMGDLAANIAFIPMLAVLQEGNSWKHMKGSRMLLFFGCNYAETSLNDWHFVMDALEAGTKLVVVDPRFTRTAAKADWWIPIRPGTDSALILGMLNVIIKEGLQDDEYIRKYTNEPFLVRPDNGMLLRDKDLGGSTDDYMVWDLEAEKLMPANAASLPALKGSFEIDLDGKKVTVSPAHQLFLDYLENYTPEKASEICEVPADDIRKLAMMYVQETPAGVYITQGTQRYWQGHLSYRAAITLGALTGNIGRKYAGVSWAGGTLFKIIAGTPASWLSPIPDYKPKALPGTELYDIIPSGKPYPIKSLWFCSYSMGTQGPNLNKLYNEVFPALDLIVVSEQMMGPTTKYADYVLPVTSWYEEECDVVGAWSNLYLQFRKQAIKPMWDAKTDWDTFTALANRMGLGEWWTMSQQESAEYIVKNSPDPIISGTSLEDLREKGVAWANQPVDFVPFEDKKFNTPSGRIEIYQEVWIPHNEQIPVFMEPFESNRNEKAKEYPLTFMNVHSVYTVHSQHTVLPWILEVNPEPRLEMHTIDAEARGLKDGDLVEVYNDRGNLKLKVKITEGIKPGCLNCYEGWWPKQFAEGHIGALTHMTLNPAHIAILETNYSPYDNLVEVRKA